MELQYITDQQGKKNAILLPISDWEDIQKDLQELQILRDKEAFLNGLKDAFNEVKQIKKGKKQPNSFEELLNEL